MKKYKSLVVISLLLSLLLVACSGGGSAKETAEEVSKAVSAATEKFNEEKTKLEAEIANLQEQLANKEVEEDEEDEDVAAPGEDAGFDEFPIGEEIKQGPLNIAGVYFQPVDMEPAGNSLSKDEADAHIEADISATAEGAELGYGKGDFVPWLTVTAYLQKEGSDKVQEVAFMPMNASDGPHYGANIKFEEGLGTYNVRFEIEAPGNEYLLHVDEETGVDGRFWTEPIIAEWTFDWEGPKW